MHADANQYSENIRGISQFENQTMYKCIQAYLQWTTEIHKKNQEIIYHRQYSRNI